MDILEKQSKEAEKLKQEVELLNQNKQFIQVQCKQMMSNLDAKAEILRKHYDSCYKTSCMNLIQPKFQQMYEKGNVMELEADKVFIEKNKENLNLVSSYNNCITECEKPIRDLRWETEFQLREFQQNINECFFFCRSNETVGNFGNQAECLNRCYDIHKTMIYQVKTKLINEYDKILTLQ